MPPTISIVKSPPDKTMQNRRQVATYTGPAAYNSTTGDVLTPEQFRMGKFFAVLTSGVATNGTTTTRLIGIVIPATPTTAVVRWYVPNTGSEVANGVDLSSFTITIEVVGQ